MIVIDENLSYKLIVQLRDLFPSLVHVRHLNLLGTADSVVWTYACQNGATAVLSADTDFVVLVHKYGPPPKVIHIAECNFSTGEIAKLLRREAVRIHAFLKSDKSVLVISR